MNLKEAIKAYLDGQVKQDAALAEKYAPEHIDLCIDYINGMAKKELDGKSGAIDDVTVYKWSRDFWLEGHLEDVLYKKAPVKKKDEDSNKAEEIADKTDAVTPEKDEEPVNLSVQTSLFGEG